MSRSLAQRFILTPLGEVDEGKREKMTKRIHVGNLGTDTTERELTRLFEQAGRVVTAPLTSTPPLPQFISKSSTVMFVREVCVASFALICTLPMEMPMR